MTKKRFTHPAYHTLLTIPEGTSGKFAVKHDHRKAGEVMPTTTIRTRIFGGHPFPDWRVPKGGATFHLLTEDGGRWTSDWPIEHLQQRQAVQGFHGHVLVGGLGIGMVAAILAQMPAVDEITIVERSKHVVKLVWPHLKKQLAPDVDVHLHTGCLHDFLIQRAAKPEDQRTTYHCAFYDIWRGDGEDTFFHQVLPLRHYSQDIPTIACWNEDIMRSQLLQSLHSRWMFASDPRLQPPTGPRMTLATLATPIGDLWRDWSARFFRQAIDEQWDWNTVQVRAIEYVRTLTYDLLPTKPALLGHN